MVCFCPFGEDGAVDPIVGPETFSWRYSDNLSTSIPLDDLSNKELEVFSSPLLMIGTLKFGVLQLSFSSSTLVLLAPPYNDILSWGVLQANSQGRLRKDSVELHLHSMFFNMFH